MTEPSYHSVATLALRAHREARAAGEAARCRGEPASANPYPASRSGHAAWMAGWDGAERPLFPEAS